MLFIHKFRSSTIPTSIQHIIFPSRDTANTRIFRLILLKRYMALSNALPPSSRVTRSLRQTTQETPLPADTLHRPGKVSNHSPTSPRCITHSRSTSQVGLIAPSTNRPFVTGIDSPLIVLRCDHLISPHNPKSRVDIRCRLVAHKSNMVLSTLRLSSFRGFNVLARGLLSRTWKQTSTPRVHGPLVLDEGEQGILTTMLKVFKVRLVAFRPWC